LKRSFLIILILNVCAAAVSGGAFAARAAMGLWTQEQFPAPPGDRSLIYVADENNKLVALPFEAGAATFDASAIAGSSKTAYVELKGKNAATLVARDSPRFYLFVPDQPGARPPVLMRLTSRKSGRRMTVMTERGMKGFALSSAEIIKVRPRGLGRDAGFQYVELRPREPLAPGEYAFVGTDLARIATFRVP
jgi:hypothetical protein